MKRFEENLLNNLTSKEDNQTLTKSLFCIMGLAICGYHKTQTINSRK